MEKLEVQLNFQFSPFFTPKAYSFLIYRHNLFLIANSIVFFFLLLKNLVFYATNIIILAMPIINVATTLII